MLVESTGADPVRTDGLFFQSVLSQAGSHCLLCLADSRAGRGVGNLRGSIKGRLGCPDWRLVSYAAWHPVRLAGSADLTLVGPRMGVGTKIRATGTYRSGPGHLVMEVILQLSRFYWRWQPDLDQVGFPGWLL